MSCGEAHVAQVGSGSSCGRSCVCGCARRWCGRAAARRMSAVRSRVVRLAQALLHAVVVRRAGGQDGARLQP